MVLRQRKKHESIKKEERVDDECEGDTEGITRVQDSTSRSNETSLSPPRNSNSAAAGGGDTAQAPNPIVRNATTTSPRVLSLLLPQLPQFYCAKWAILRLMGCMYFAAFAAAWFQNVGLMGEHGLQPASVYVKRLHQAYSDNTSLVSGFLKHPSLFWWLPLTDFTMNAVNLIGMLLSSVVVVCAGANSWLVQLLLWLLYFSIVTTAGGTSFYQYGWESQILETGFLCVFLCTLPHFDGAGRFHWVFYECHHGSNWPTATHRPTAIALWLFQWLIFRISTGAGLIKVRGSSCWTQKTCLYYHFETQPIPSPLSFAYHFAPMVVQRRMVDTDLVVQLYTAWMVLIPACCTTAAWLPRRVDRVVRGTVRLGGFLQTGFMVGILLSGNFSVLNHLTIVPALACLDDACWPRCLRPRHSRDEQVHHPETSDEGNNEQQGVVAARVFAEQEDQKVPFSRRVIDAMLLCLILFLSRPVIDNLLQRGGHRQQLMNASFDSFRLVNTYGAFGSVGKTRYEVIVQISDNGEEWTELEFPCKPGNLYRRPCFCAPYHYRLDWNIWFIGFKPHQSYLRSRETWLYNLLRKLLDADDERPRPWLDLLDRSSKDYLISTFYKAKRAPKYVKVDMYHYKMAAPLWTILRQKLQAVFSATEVPPVAWWARNFEEVLIPPISLESIR